MDVVFIPLETQFQWEWIHERAGANRCNDTRAIIAMDAKTKKYLGAVVMDNWTETSVQCHWVIEVPSVLRHGFLEEVAEFVFDHAGREVMIALIPANNEKSLKLAKHIGFRELIRVEKAYDAETDYVVLEGRRHDLARWLPQEDAA